MNAAQLFTNELYAWKRTPPKGRIPTDAIKVRLRHTEQVKKSYMHNRQTLAAITEVETGRERTVPAREIIMFWDEYEGERDHLLAERREADMDRRRVQLRRTVIEAMTNFRLHEKGIPVALSYYSVGSATINNVEGLHNWLGINEDDITLAIEKQMEEEYGEETT